VVAQGYRDKMHQKDLSSSPGGGNFSILIREREREREPPTPLSVHLTHKKSNMDYENPICLTIAIFNL
jgi:hypothetical protein